MLCWHILCSSIAFTVASRRAASRISAFVHPSVRSQHRKTASGTSSMYHHVFKLRGRLLSISSRAALAASAGSCALPSHPDRESGQERWASSSSSNARLNRGSGWLHSSQPALAMAASGGSARSVPLKIPGGTTAATRTDGQYLYCRCTNLFEQHSSSSTAAVAKHYTDIEQQAESRLHVGAGFVYPKIDAAGCVHV